jgi:hypothetical protein
MRQIYRAINLYMLYVQTILAAATALTYKNPWTAVDSPRRPGLIDLDSEGVRKALDRGLSSPNPSIPIIEYVRRFDWHA